MVTYPSSIALLEPARFVSPSLSHLVRITCGCNLSAGTGATQRLFLNHMIIMSAICLQWNPVVWKCYAKTLKITWYVKLWPKCVKIRWGGIEPPDIVSLNWCLVIQTSQYPMYLRSVWRCSRKWRTYRQTQQVFYFLHSRPISQTFNIDICSAVGWP